MIGSLVVLPFPLAAAVSPAVEPTLFEPPPIVAIHTILRRPSPPPPIEQLPVAFEPSTVAFEPSVEYVAYDTQKMATPPPPAPYAPASLPPRTEDFLCSSSDQDVRLVALTALLATVVVVVVVLNAKRVVRHAL